MSKNKRDHSKGKIPNRNIQDMFSKGVVNKMEEKKSNSKGIKRKADEV